MKTILSILLLCLLCTHWHQQRKESIRTFIHARSGTDTECLEALEDAKVRFDMSEEEVKEWEHNLYM